MEESKLKPNTTETLTVTAIDAFGNKATAKQNIRILDQKMISKSFGDASKPLSDQINQYLSDHGMNSSQVAIAYQNLETKETYYLNENNWMVAGSTYKLPLNMLFEDAINQGIYQTDSHLLYCSYCYEDIKGTIDHDYGVGSYIPLDTLMKNSIVDSCNTASHILFETLGGWSCYREKAKQYSPAIFYSVDYAVSNDVSAAYLMNILEVLYEHQEDYNIVLNYMKEADPNAYLKQYVHYPIAQKYGEYEGAQNVAGIVYAPTPYAVVILTDNAPNEQTTVGELSALIANYHVHQETH